MNQVIIFNTIESHKSNLKYTQVYYFEDLKNNNNKNHQFSF